MKELARHIMVDFLPMKEFAENPLILTEGRGIYVTDVDAYRASLSELGEVWRLHFGRRYPAMALVGVAALFEPDAKVELMGVAVLADG